VILLVRPFADRVVKPWPAALPHDEWDIFEVRPDGSGFGYCEGGWAIDRSPIPARGKWPIWFVHVPAIPWGRSDLMMGQERFEEPPWLCGRDASEAARTQPAESWVRGCWLDFDTIADRHRLALQQTGHCWLTRWEAEAALRTMTDAVSCDLTRYADG
jgi:hypothetical protein